MYRHSSHEKNVDCWHRFPEINDVAKHIMNTYIFLETYHKFKWKQVVYIMVNITKQTFYAVWLLLARVTFITADDVIAGTGRRTITARCEANAYKHMYVCIHDPR